MTTTIQDLISQWRGIAKAREAAALDRQLVYMDPLVADRPTAAEAWREAKLFKQCADDLEKALAGIVSPTGGGVAS